MATASDPPAHADLVSGEWYESQYATPGARYHDIYTRPTPQWAVEANIHHVALVCAWLAIEPIRGERKVLEIGCGVGRYLEVWHHFGFSPCGIDISPTAVAHARERVMVDVWESPSDDLPFGGGDFDLVFSAAFMEHCPREKTARTLQEAARVARYQAHYIPLEAGDDPSHIHVQSVEEWVGEMIEALPDHHVAVVDNVMEPSQPLYLIYKPEDATWPLRRHKNTFHRP